MVNVKNGNANITFHENGTRIIDYNDELDLDYPLNIDIKVSSKCSLGYNPVTKTAFCDFCHESNVTDGVETDYESLKEKLSDLPFGIELAIGSNNLTDNLVDFLVWAKYHGFFCNITINQAHLKRDFKKLKYVIEEGLIKGLGVSYRSSLKWTVPEYILNYPNTVFHVIIGIDDINDVLTLREKGVKKILCLGEKNFGFNLDRVDLTSIKHKQWVWWVSKVFDTFQVSSFDNLALEQLKLKRFFSDKSWERFNQMEHSFYINSVDGYFSPSSRNPNRVGWEDIDVKSYYSDFIKDIKVENTLNG